MERNAFLINKKIHQYILPGVLMTVAMQLGNVVDGMIVGNLLGAEAMAAIRNSKKPAGCSPPRWQPDCQYRCFLHCLRQSFRDLPLCSLPEIMI